ncbi:MAG: hypothetical protein HFI38_06130 [Lachnospiraceae bacterium]|nr:hypothetical protein [Lachnospiraceae bacterium]
MKEPHFFGIRHLSPAGAWYLRKFLEEKAPSLVLVEGPSDFCGLLGDMVKPETKPPVAILAYTNQVPVRTILYPFAEYSPEYQAILWCSETKVPCRFIDLPSPVFLALGDTRQKQEGQDSYCVYEELDRQAGEDGHETFWERVMEQAGDTKGYHEGANLFGASLRKLSEDNVLERAENTLREAYMQRQIRSALEEGFDPEQIVVVTGSYHVEGLRGFNEGGAMTDEELEQLPRLNASHTLMPYSYYRLSSRSGYGAGNRAPAYYGLIWKSLCAGEIGRTAHEYLARIASYQRANGTPVSSAEVIEAVRLAGELAHMRGESLPALRDLKDAAVTCLGGGNPAAVSLAMADTEIGTAIGALPDGVSRTSIQEDFYRVLKDLRLEKYRDLTAQDLHLDLRENRSVKSEKAAFLDLHRSFFLHDLRVLGVSFGAVQKTRQDNATWAEHWILRWSPEAEIELVEAALLGDTVEQAASFRMKERVEQAGAMKEIAEVIEDAFTCGIPASAEYAIRGLQAMMVEAVSLEELSAVAARLSAVIRYGTIRQVDPKPLEPILSQLFYRACLLLPGACVCDDAGSNAMLTAMEQLNGTALAHEFLDQEAWLRALLEVAGRDDLNTRLSGFGTAILLERRQMTPERLKREVRRRLSKGTPADLGAGWFEGLAMKNRYALIARLSLWESLDEYLDSLDEEEFKRALVFLRRAFADFSSLEKDEIAENLGELWQIDGQSVSAAVNAPIPKEEEEEKEESGLGEDLDDFDFDI